MSWPLVNLGSIAEKIDYGLTASANFELDEPKFLRITDLQDGSVDWSSVPSCECSEKDVDQYKLEHGDIVFARTGATTGKSYLLRDLAAQAVFASYLIRLRPKKIVDSSYLAHFFQSPNYWSQINVMANGAAQPGVNASKLKELSVPLPPLEEQKRIAAILDKADAIRRKRQQAIKLADDFLRSVFLEMFGDPVTNPKGLKVVPLIELCEKVTDGTHQSPKWESSGIPFLFISNIVDGKINYETSKYISEATYKLLTKSTPIELNDILYTTVGSYGNVALVSQANKFCFQRHIAHIKPNSKKIDSNFLSDMLSSSVIRKQVDRLVKGVAQKTLNLKDLKNIKVFDLEFSEQKKFLEKSHKVSNFKEKSHHSLASAELFFSSLSQKAFLGQL